MDLLFATGKSFSVFPIRVTYLYSPESTSPVLQMGVSVSKKHFKNAVDRNRMKRLIREAYRLQKLPLKKALEEKGWSGYVFFIYTDKVKANFEDVKKAMARCLKQLEQRLPRKNEKPA